MNAVTLMSTKQFYETGNAMVRSFLFFWPEESDLCIYYTDDTNSIFHELGKIRRIRTFNLDLYKWELDSVPEEDKKVTTNIYGETVYWLSPKYITTEPVNGLG